MLRISLDDLSNFPLAEKEEPALKIRIGEKELAFSPAPTPADQSSAKEKSPVKPKAQAAKDGTNWLKAEASIKAIEAEENRIRKERAKLSNHYHTLENQHAPLDAFERNYQAIESLTDELKRLWLRKRHLETHGEDIDQPVKTMNADEELQLSKLKYTKRRLTDKKSKLKAKIETAYASANPARNEARWTQQLSEVELDIAQLDKQIESLQNG